MAHDVFISYSNIDKPIADGICANLEVAGIRCWIAPRDITPGEDWPTAISNAISHSRVMVLVFSSQSNSSEDVSRELMLAADNKLIIIPFKIENVEPGPGMKYYLARTHWLDAMNPPTQEQILLLVDTAKKLLSSKDAIPSPVMPLAPLRPPIPARKSSARRVAPWILSIGIPALIILCIGACGGGLLLGSQLVGSKHTTQTATFQPLLAGDETLPSPTNPEAGLSFTPVIEPSDQPTLPSGTNTSEPVGSATPPIDLGPSFLPTPIPLSARAISVENAATVKRLSILDVSEGGSLLWSRDGRWLVIGGNEILLFDAKTLKETRSLEHEGFFMAISPDSRTLAAASSLGVTLFDMAGGAKPRTLPRTEIDANAFSIDSCLAFTPDSSILAVIINDVVKFFDVASGEETGTIVTKGARHIYISPDGKTLYTAGDENQVTAWEISTGRQIFTLGKLIAGSSNMILSPDGRMIVTASDDTMILWDTLTELPLRTFSGHTQTPYCLAFSPDSKILASASDDVSIKLWNVATGDLLASLVGHSVAPRRIDISPDGSMLASITYADGVLLWGLPAT